MKKRRTWTRTDTVPVSFFFPEEVLKEINRISQEKKLILSQLVGELLENFLNKYENVELVDLPFTVPERFRDYSKKKSTTITLDKDLWKRVSKYKKEKGLTKYQLITLALADYLNEKGGKA